MERKDANMSLDRETVHNLRNNGMSFADIGRMFGVTRQRIYNIYSGYDKIYKKTERYKMYKRHVKSHEIGAVPLKPCDYCDPSTPTTSIGVTQM